jgi:hypothetical protein
MSNRYTRALKQLKNKTLDEKMELLEALPTNSTIGLYTDVPGVVTPETTSQGDIDSALNLDQDGDGAEGYAGVDTTGLFMEDGTIRAVEPPGDTSYVLGPMISMWYSWANYTQIGYVRQSDRRMVNLGRITGELDDWDGETGFTSYGQLTLEQAVWYQGQSRQDYRAFYPGPPSNPADTYGRYIGSIVSTSKSTTVINPRFFTPGTNRQSDPTDNYSLAMDNMGGWLAAAAALGFVFNTVREFFNWWNNQNEEMKQKLRDLVDPPQRTRELRLQDVAGLRPDGTQGMNKLGDTNRGHDGTLYKLVPRPGYGYNMWVPVKKAGGGNTMVAHYEPKGELLSEDRKRILRDIKKPVQVKEMPTKFKVKPTGRKNKSVGVDMMKIPDTPKQYKPQTNIWQKQDYNANVRASQEKKNEVLELLGAAEHHWTYLTEDRRRQKQERVNEELSAEFDKQLEVLYEKHKLKEGKVNKTISAVKNNIDVAPDDAPPTSPPAAVMPNGYHSKYGKHHKHDKLDPHSAESMPPTGDPEIDANIKKATNTKEKARKLKILLGKKA